MVCKRVRWACGGVQGIVDDLVPYDELAPIRSWWWRLARLNLLFNILVWAMAFGLLRWIIRCFGDSDAAITTSICVGSFIIVLQVVISTRFLMFQSHELVQCTCGAAERTLIGLLERPDVLDLVREVCEAVVDTLLGELRPFDWPLAVVWHTFGGRHDHSMEPVTTGTRHSFILYPNFQGC